MPADQTPRCCADDPMMACIVAGSASHHGALEAPFGRGGRGGQPGWKQDNQDQRHSHRRSFHRRLDRLRRWRELRSQFCRPL